MILFTKMHSLGNHFVVIDAYSTVVNLENFDIKKMSACHIGIGFDQLLIIEKSSTADFFCKIFNADGSEAVQCGNGLRCVARFVHENKMIASKEITIETKAGVFPISIQDYQQIQVTMGNPVILSTNHVISIEDQSYSLITLNLGNPHALLIIDHLLSIKEMNRLGKLISTHTDFPDGINVGFMQIVSPTEINLRTYERGAGLTYACGSNATAAVAAGIIVKQLHIDKDVQVHFPLGTVKVIWPVVENAICLIGSAERIFEGQLPLS